MYCLKAILIITLVTASSSAASILPRQIGGIGCNIARLQIVSALDATGKDVNKIQDAAVAQAAKAGVDQAFGGIGQIAKALLSGQTAPASSRNTTEAGLTAASQALAGGDTSDPAVAAAQSSLQDAQKAGKEVVAKC